MINLNEQQPANTLLETVFFVHNSTNIKCSKTQEVRGNQVVETKYIDLF